MDQLDHDFKKLARRTKIKRWLITALIALVSTAVVLLAASYLFFFRAEKNQRAMHQEINLANTLFSPNFAVKYKEYDDHRAYSGELTAVRTKNIDGYPVYLGTVNGKFDAFNYWTSVHGGNFEATTTIKLDNGVFEGTSKQKIPQFYNSKVVNSTFRPTMQLADLAAMENYVGELAVTFDKSYSYEEIQEFVPDDLVIGWYWFTPVDDYDPNASDSFNTLGIHTDAAMGEGTITEADYATYKKSVKTYLNLPMSENNKKASAQSTTYQNLELFQSDYKTLADAKFSGVILTGKSENFATLNTANWIYASSIGSTVERVSYIEPLK